ncbi:MAG TPA: glycosyltransferase family 4 protein [Actinomycetota bacterium]|nr:glycosyltransferase family 4 protein [Actinomycetota bacterium]
MTVSGAPATRHLLVTNDFPPKVGGIQTYLWELWRRLPPDSFAVLTTAHPQDAGFDAAQPFRVERLRARVLWPTPALGRRIDAMAAELGAGLVVLDPALPLGAIGPSLSRPYVLMAHGAEITVPGRIPGARPVLARVLRGSAGAVAGGCYVAGELRRAAGRPLDVVLVPPGVDTDRFLPLGGPERRNARHGFGIPLDGPLVVHVGRLVPRKGADVLIEAVALLRSDHPDLTLAVAGGGRDRARLERLALRCRAPVRFLGRVPDDRLPALYGCADVFAAPNRTRWAGLEQEGFGIVFIEAAACGVPQVAGNSGGAPEAVAHGDTGLLVDRPEDPAAVAGALAALLDDSSGRARLGGRARERAAALFTYDVLATRLGGYLTDLAGRLV